MNEYLYRQTLMILFRYFQDQIDAVVKVLLSLKAEFKAATGKDWKPGQAVAAAQPVGGATPSPTGGVGDANVINQKITDQGTKVRQLKAEKAGKVC